MRSSSARPVSNHTADPTARPERGRHSSSCDCPCRLAERPHQIGIQPGPARSTALFQLATELPAAILARMLGIHIDVAVAWQRISARDWMTYAADVSRRPAQEQPSPSPGRPLETETS